jgi:hypothetical protein
LEFQNTHDEGLEEAFYIFYPQISLTPHNVVLNLDTGLLHSIDIVDIEILALLGLALHDLEVRNLRGKRYSL